MSKIKFLHFVFNRNKRQSDTYDIAKDKNADKSDFKFIRLSTPRENYLVVRGVRYVMQSFSGKYKTLHTGLIPLYNNDNFYFGDYLKDNNKRDFLIVHKDTENLRIDLYIIKDRNPRDKTNFVINFIANLNL